MACSLPLLGVRLRELLLNLRDGPKISCPKWKSTWDVSAARLRRLRQVQKGCRCEDKLAKEAEVARKQAELREAESQMEDGPKPYYTYTL